MEIIPAILTGDLKDLQEKITKVSGLVERVQIDLLDGEFADNKTIDWGTWGDLGNIKLDVHLMVKEPVAYLDKKAQNVDRVIGQIEMMENQSEFVNKVIEEKLLAGLAIDLGTPVSQIDETLMSELDTVLVMAVKAGFQNQEFEEYALDKVRELAEISEGKKLKFKICVDGGVEVGNIKKIAQAGADEVVAGSSLFEGDIEENLKKFKEALN